MINFDDLKVIADLSIPLKFDGPQPNAFGVEAAASKTLGDTREGSSINFERYTFTPHCNGTHTECVGHITNERISVRDCLKDVIVPALLVSVEAVNDEPIGVDALKDAGVGSGDPERALIVRTMPNNDTKLTTIYGEKNIPAYFSLEAIVYIFACGFKHLLVDLPSIDRLYDEGELAAHRIFWNVESGSSEINELTRVSSTITELIYVPNDVADGEYYLNLQVAPFVSDAAPSRPILLRVSGLSR